MVRSVFLIMLLFVISLHATEIETDKDVYGVDEEIVVSFEDLEGEANEWLAIFPAGSNNDFGHIVQWNLTGAVEEGSVNFQPLKVGEYQIRLFRGANPVDDAEVEILVEGNNLPTSVKTTKDIYTTAQKVVANLQNMSGDNEDWIGIYPAGSNNAWENMIDWKWVAGDINAIRTFDPLPAGEYEVRVFFNNSFNKEAGYLFSVEGDNPVTSVKTDKDIYTPEEEILASFENMSEDDEDWIGIYPAGSENTWANMIDWKWIAGDIEGTRRFNALAAGDYEVRVFFENSFKVEASYAFSVEGNEFRLAMRKNPYDPFELIHVDFENLPGLDSDWIGIFEVGAEHAKETAIEFKATNNLVNGEVSFNGLEAGEYEARAYFQGQHQKTVPFRVQEKAIERVLYDDFEDGVLDERWVRVQGQNMTINNYGVNPQGVPSTGRKTKIIGQKSLRTYRDYRGGQNHSGYYFNFENPDPKLKFLEVDVSIGQSSHVFAFGVKIKTKFGDRRIEFASWLNHTMPDGRQIIRGPYGNVLPGHRGPFTQDNYLFVHPGPSDYYVGTSGVGGGSNMMIHYKINIEEKLRLMEPENEFLGMILFTTSGGDYDNLALTTH